MAGTTAAVTAIVSKLDALLQEEAPEEQQHRNGGLLPRGARRGAGSIRTEFLAALSLVSRVSADEGRADLRWQLVHGGIRQQVDRAVRVLDELLREMDMDHPPPGRTTTAAPPGLEHRARSRALRELCHGYSYAYGYNVAAEDSSLDASPSSSSAAARPGYCARTLRELCYDTEDFLDDFSSALKKRRPAPALPRRWRGPPFLFPSARNWWAMAKAARRVHRKLSDVELVATETTKRLFAELDTSSPRAVAIDAAAASIVPVVEEDDPRRHPLPVPALAAALVGVDGQRDELARMLLVGEEGGDGKAVAAAAERQVVIIVGDAGTGKTTLAHEVYRAIGDHFHCRAWVSASENRSWQSVLADILDQVKDEDPPGSFAFFCKDDDEKLINRSLEHKRYLILLDDISLVDGWNLCFPWNSLGSRILITATRDDRIVRSNWPRLVTRFYYMSSLTGDYARLLFHRRVFGAEDRCPPDLAQVADQVLRQCHGSPLAITVMSGLLANKPRTRPVWEDICSCIGLSNTSSSGTEEICLMGYYALPNYLKTCLVYLSSVFPEDHPISRDRAVRSWISEGFVSEEHGATLEEAGQSYFDDLVSRNMIQQVACCGYGNYEGKPEVYTIHGLIRRILTRENFATLLDNGKNESKSGGDGELTRRLTITNAEKDVGIPESMDISHTRSLFIFGGALPRLSFRDFMFLRVLDLEGCNDLENRHVVEIAELVHLRYLSIRDTAISELPHQICQLQHLTTLDLRGTSVEEIPASVVYLQRLKHLLCDKMRLPEWIRKVAALSHLSLFDIFQSRTVAMELGIWWDTSAAESNDAERYEQFAFSIYRLKGLQSLCIHGSDGSVDFLDHLHHPLGRLQKIQLNGSCYVNRIPSWFRSLPALAYLRIDVKEVKNEDLQLLSELPSLRHLSLSSRTVPTEKLVISRDGFPVLQEFQLCSVRSDLAFEPQAMRMLETLLLSVHVLPEETHGFSISIDQFMCLKQIEIRIDCKRRVVDASELVEAQNVAIRNAAGHPNCPAVRIMHTNLIVKSLNCALEEGKAKM